MESYSERLRAFSFDSAKIKEVGEDHFKPELFAALSSESVSKTFLEHAFAGRVFPNPNNSALGYVLGITNEKPTSKPPVWMDTDLPDIDVDFSDAKRDLVFAYAEQKYGSDHVARLGTVGMLKTRSALKQAGAVLGVPSWETEKLADVAIERDAGDARALKCLEDTFADTGPGKKFIERFPNMAVAARIEGHPNVASQHAAGLLLTQDPISEYVAVSTRTKAAWCDKKDAESLNLLKIDALGLTQLSIFERAMELIGVEPRSAFLEALPLDDPKVFDVLNAKKFSGVFQFAGAALRRLASQVHFSRIEDVVALTALARPGPMASGVAEQWVRRHNGKERVEEIHPAVDRITAGTYGLIAYQETVMQMVREVGGFSWEDTSAVRKIMGKSQGAEALEKFSKDFAQGAASSGLHPEEAARVWNQIKTMGGYAFNKSHAVAYAIISYWCCWFKAYHPLAFAAATLDAENDASKQILLLRELREEGVSYAPFLPHVSTARWEIATDGSLVGPLTAIKGIGPAKVSQILKERREGGELSPGLQKQLARATTEIDTLDPIRDAVSRLHPDLRAINIISDPTPGIQIQPGIRGAFVFIGLLKRMNIKNENTPAELEKRKGKPVFGPDKSLNLFLVDDTDEVFAKIDRYAFERLSPKVLEVAKAGKSLFAIKGTCPEGFRMIKVEAIRYLGDYK